MKTLWHNLIDMPPVWLLAFMAGIWLLAQVWNPFEYNVQGVIWLGRGIIAAGLALMTVAAAMFWRHPVGVVPKRTPKTIIKNGPYRYSRNPIYLADAFVLCGFALTLGSIIGVLLVPVFTRIIQKRFIEGEEKRIRAEFGNAYDSYCNETRRWL